MDEKVKDQDVLLVKEKSSGELKVVTGIEKDGKPKAVEAKPENEPSFLKIDKTAMRWITLCRISFGSTKTPRISNSSKRLSTR